jgi:tetratricopeptide (TPR) repeat protein
MKGERNNCLTEFHAIFSTEADFFLYHYEMGRIFEAWGEKEKALQEYKRALMFNPNLEQASVAVKRLEGPKDRPAATPTTPGLPKK